MSTVECPYCKAEQEINHDDGYGYEEGKDHEQTCGRCGKEFAFETSIIFHYTVFCKEEPHDMVKGKHLIECSKCDYYELHREAVDD